MSGPRLVHHGIAITTDATVVADLKASLVARGVPAGGTFGDFLEVCRAFGVKDSTPLDAIEFRNDSGRIFVEWDQASGAARIGERK